MILFTILMLMAALLTLFTVIIGALGGSIFVILFGDVIVCIFLLVGIMRILSKKKR